MTNKMKSVTKEEFLEFIKNYPRKLSFNTDGRGEPPFSTYNDFTLGNYPDSIVASCFRNDYLKNEGDHDFKILSSEPDA